jgi:hypothetical protein
MGDRYISVADHAGPASYATLVVASPPTGGDTVSVAEFGFKSSITAVMQGMSDDGQYLVKAVDTQPGRGEIKTLQMIWVVAATGAQVANATNLSARKVRLFAIGR